MLLNSFQKSAFITKALRAVSKAIPLSLPFCILTHSSKQIHELVFKDEPLMNQNSLHLPSCAASPLTLVLDLELDFDQYDTVKVIPNFFQG